MATRISRDPGAGAAAAGSPAGAGRLRFLVGRAVAGDDDELGGLARRVVRYALLATAVLGALALIWSARAALFLTAAGLLGIFSFRGLEAQVRALAPRADRRLGKGNLGTRSLLLIVLRHSLLIAFIVAALLTGSREFIALILGFSVVPLALLVSGFASIR